jgi:hypothetical protein
MEREHKVTESLPTDAFDKLLSRLIGLPNGAHARPTVVQSIDFYGNATSYIVQTVKTEEGTTAFVEQISASGSARYILPPAVLGALDRQRDSLTTKIRRRHGKRIAEERAAAGIQPGFMKKRRGRK